MTFVTVRIDNPYHAFMLAHLLTDEAVDHDRRAYEWWARHGEKDAVYESLTASSKFLHTLAKEVTKASS